MELREFVQKTLVGIVQGVADAQEQLGSTAVLNPYRVESGKAYSAMESARGVHQKIESVRFDVAVTTDEGGTTGKAAIRVAGVSIGGEVDVPASSQTTSRIQFAVDLLLPAYEAPKPDIEFNRKR